jgi:POT family proton-dependent oligopeptide transporter
MGINTGGALGPILCGVFGDTGNPADFRWGFLAAGIGMLLGVLIFKRLKDKYVIDPSGKTLGLTPESASGKKELGPAQILVYGALLAFSLAVIGILYVDARLFSILSYLLVISVVGIGYMIIADKTLTLMEKKRISVIFIVSFFVIFFWSAFEQAGASLTFFAEEQTQRAERLAAKLRELNIDPDIL